MAEVIVIGERPLSIEDIWRIARRDAIGVLSDRDDVRERIGRSATHMARAIADGRQIYGVNTGYGDSCDTPIDPQLVAELPLHLTRFHGCGMGRILSDAETRAVMAVRLASLATGWSGISLELLRLLSDMLRLDILPEIPAEGSVGASGDLTPLSYIAGALCGERRVRYGGQVRPAKEIFAQTGLHPAQLRPKEALAIMNGTAVMSGLGALVFMRADGLSRLASRLTALASIAILGNPGHFDRRLFASKPHPGQMRIAARIRDDLSAFAAGHQHGRPQDGYSIRCAPHVIGVLEDMLPAYRRVLDIEINSANDNPLLDPEDGQVLHGGHFYGGHVAHVMDSLKTLLANLADLMDRQMCLLVDARFNNGLPANLSGAIAERACINHGLKAVQIASSAWAAEALKLTMPASVFSRSTECHNQDKVSMGTIAARDALRVSRLTEQVAAALLVACVQAVRLRLVAGEVSRDRLGHGLAAFLDEVGETIPFVEEDMPLDACLRELCAAQESRAWVLDWPEDRCS